MSLRWKGTTPAQLGKLWEKATVEAREETRLALRAGAALVKSESQKNAPIDTGDLEKAHRFRKVRSSKTSASYEVFVSGGGRINIYAPLMHEGVYNLGPKSRAKQARNPNRTIGRKYLDRAAKDSEEEIFDSVFEALIGGF